ncbi:MAG: helix-turn-helix transcriptional regulator [Oscillospiraceae bacterium]
MEIYGISYNHRHKGDFKFTSPQPFNGHMLYLFVIFKTPAVIKENDEEEKLVEKGTFALYTPDAKYSIQGFGNEYIDDWIVFDLNLDDIKLLESLQIPLNKAVKLYSISSISDIIHKIAFEFHDAYNIYRHDVMQLLMQLLFFKLSQHLYLRIPVFSKKSFNPEKYETLLNIRNEIYCSPHMQYSIEELAQKALMSKSYFQHTYKEIFGITVTQEIMKSRLNHSKYYPSCTDMTIKDIAFQCGFNSDVYFVRSFKKFFGITPTEYRGSIIP